MANQKYTEEFREEAVRQVLEFPVKSGRFSSGEIRRQLV